MKRKFIIIITSFLFLKIISFGQVVFDTKKFGQQILDGKINPAADIKTFRVVDSLFCKNESDKWFYLKVANKIVLKCDGALSEYVCRVANKFYFNNTSYFIEASKTMNKEVLYKWLNFIADDLYMDNHEGVKGLKKIKFEIDETASPTLSMSTSQMALRKKYNAYIYRLTEQMVRSE